MAIISAENKFCFIHIYRTGGTTIQEALRKQVFDLKILNPLHSTIEYTLDKFPQVQNYIKFSYVRNPYDLLISIYTDILTSGKNTDYLHIKDIGFYKFIQWLYEVGMKREETSLEPFYRTQTDSLYINKKSNIDEIYKYETLCNDSGSSSLFSLFSKLNLRFPNSVPLTKKSDRDISYGDIYDYNTYKLVNTIFKEDFKNFKYNTYAH